ncbi:Copia protein [Phytophthora megakarya]|uniref:Copia protein n=1 Tax=Phytophthora megakarya TaxID=4795 RepID=A0A225WJT1_9STRA|nr:Copia protein [Phytophthora megakarya]
MDEELKALEETGVWKAVRVPRGVRVLHTKWVYKTKKDAEGAAERLKARLAACGNEQEFGVNYSITFSAVMNMGSVKLILCLAKKWRVPAKHGDVSNAYVKADKEVDLDIYIHLLQGMKISEEMRERLGVASDEELGLELKKALYSLKQAGRLWSKLLHQKLVSVGFEQSLTEMCIYFRWRQGEVVVVGVYVDDLLVTGTKTEAVDAFFGDLADLSVKNLGVASKFLSMRVTYADDDGCHLDQEVMITDMLKEFDMEAAHAARTPIGAEWNEEDNTKALPAARVGAGVTIKRFQSLVGSLMWVARCTRSDIAFAVHKASRKMHSPSLGDYRLAKRILRYLAGTKELRLRMKGSGRRSEAFEVVAYSDPDFAGDKQDKKSVTGGVVTLDGMPVIWVSKAVSRCLRWRPDIRQRP